MDDGVFSLEAISSHPSLCKVSPLLINIIKFGSFLRWPELIRERRRAEVDSWNGALVLLSKLE
jgi:hypothetical protein